MTPRRILVTGSSGFVGRQLLPRLRAEFHGAEVVGPNEDALDVTETERVSALIEAIRPDAVVHLAAISVPAAVRAAPDRAWSVNLHGTLALANAIMRKAPDCLLLHVSSADVYGGSHRSHTPLDEAATLAPTNLYAATKAAADLALGAMSGEGLRCIRLRPFNHTGAGQSPQLVIAAFARQIARIEARLTPPVIRVGELDPVRDFLDVRDVCAAYVAALREPDALGSGAVLNVASGVGRRIGDVLDEMLAIAGVRASIEIEPGLLRRSETSFAIGNADAARAVLCWSPAIAWEHTLRDVIDDWRARIQLGE